MLGLPVASLADQCFGCIPPGALHAEQHALLSHKDQGFMSYASKDDVNSEFTARKPLLAPLFYSTWSPFVIMYVFFFCKFIFFSFTVYSSILITAFLPFSLLLYSSHLFSDISFTLFFILSESNHPFYLFQNTGPPEFYLISKPI